MFEEFKKQFSLIQLFLILSIIGISYYLLTIFWSIVIHFSDIILILIISWLVSFILEPLVEGIQSLTKLPRLFSALLCYIVISVFTGIIIFLFIPEITQQFITLNKIIPQYASVTPEFAKKITDFFQDLLNNSLTYLPTIAQFIGAIFIILIISFYFIVDKQTIQKELFALTPHKWHPHISFIQNVIDESFASFLRIQLFYGIATGIFTWILLRLFSIDYAASSSVLSGIMGLIPLIGPIFALIPPLFVTFIQNPSDVITITILLLVEQQIVFNIVGPKLLGNALKVHPVVILISFFISYKIAGAIGILFAIPALGVITILFREFHTNHFSKQ